VTYFQAIILGMIQGASEFLPISSSGHLVLAPTLFGWEFQPREAFIFDVLVQVATLSAVIIYYWQDLKTILYSWIKNLLAGQPFQEPESRLGWYLILSTIPAGFSALIFKDTLEASFSNPKFAAIFLLVTSLLLVIGELAGNRTRGLSSITWLDSLLIGFFQVLALFPGISRSGSTISGGLLRNFDRATAARYSFLMAVPVMTAAGLMAGYDLIRSPLLLSNLPVYFAGFVSAAIVGYLAIRWLITYLSQRSLYVFALYCALAGVSFLIFLFL
jgi:undecaprenyl-diphosphatase